MAFALPCCAIVMCYARIFYIVRKTALKLQENQLVTDSSGRTLSNQPTSSIKRNQRNGNSFKKLSAENVDVVKDSPSPSTETNISLEGLNKENKKKFLSKTKDEDLKFIDTSVESDLPPTLSQLQRKSVKIFIDDSNDKFIVNQLENEQLNVITKDPQNRAEGEKKGVPIDSAVGESITNSFDQVSDDDKIIKLNQLKY